MNKLKSIDQILSGWKILIPILIGLLVSGGMVYNSLSKVSFVKVKKGQGEYAWYDSNKNNKVDLNDSKDFISAKNGDYNIQTISDAFNSIKWTLDSYFWIAVALILMVCRDLFYIIRIRILTKNQLNWKAATYVILIWEFASALSPGVVGGAAVAMFILNRETIPFGKATAIVIITAFMDNLFFVLMIPLVLLFVNAESFLGAGDSSLFLTWWFWSGFGVIFFICGLLYFTLFWYPKLATKFLLFLFKFPLIKHWSFIAHEWGKDIERAAIEFKQENRSFWLKTFGATFFSWTSRYLVINAILNAFLDLGFIENFKVLGKQLILWLFMLVSPTPGGSGVAEFAFGELLGDLTGSLLVITALALLWRLISYFPYLIIGAIIVPNWLKRTRK